MGFIPKTISKKQASDTGMAFVLILLIIGLYTRDLIYFKIATPVLVINMIFPMFYYRMAFVWFGLANLLGAFMSKVILSVIYFILVVPVGFFRRMAGKDPLQLKKFKAGHDSVMITRNKKFTIEDIEKPY